MLHHFQHLNAQADSLIAGAQDSLMQIVLTMLFAALMDVQMFVKEQVIVTSFLRFLPKLLSYSGSRSPARPSSGSQVNSISNKQNYQLRNIQSQPAETKPYVRCPSAMKCVPKINCDFEGVMRNQVFNLSPEMEMLRVPLIVSRRNLNNLTTKAHHLSSPV